MNLTKISHDNAAAYFCGRTFLYAADATLGRGRDALFAASLLPSGGKVFGFDVQKDAVSQSKKLFEKNGISERGEFFEAGHERMKEFLPAACVGKIGCVFFNLGWLPGSDKTCVTKPENTISALEQSLEVMDKNLGYLSVLCYRGHDGGGAEFF